MNSKICFYTVPYPRIKNYFDMIDEAAASGLSSVEGFSTLDFKEPDTEMAKRIKEYADEKKITFPCFSVYANIVGSKREEMIEKLKGYAECAKILGSPYLHHTIAGEFSDPLKVLPFKEEFFSQGISGVREIFDYCESIGISAIYEEQGYIFNGISGVERLLNAADRDIHLVADFANIYQSADNVYDYINAFKGRFVHAHIKDITLTFENPGEGLATLTGKFMNEVPVGEGIVDVKKVVQLLKESGYNGYYGIEYGAKSDDSPVIKNTLKLVNEAFLMHNS